MTAADPRRRLMAALDRGINAWFDAGRDGAALWILLGLFVVLWTGFQVVSFASLDLHPDLTEVFAWSRHPSSGYHKHPPLGGLIVAAWFAVFPVADWSFHLFAMVNAAVALFAVDLIARRYVDGDKRLFVLLLLLLTPFYQFHSQRFGANQTLLSTWPIATYCFLRAFESRGVAWSAAAGAMAALAMLGKYYSIYLVAGFVIAALCHPARWRYLRSASPWVSTLVACVVVSPHLYWLAAAGFLPLGYAMEVHGGNAAGTVLLRTLTYALGAIGYVALPLIVYVWVVGPDRRGLALAIWPANPGRRMLVVLLAVPLVLPMLTAPFFGLTLTSLWSMAAWFLLPIILLAPQEITLSRAAAVRVTFGILAFTALLAAVSPGIAWIKYFQSDAKNGHVYFRVVAEELTRAWRRTMQRPLTIVMGGFDYPEAVTFYSSDHPDAVPTFSRAAAPWVTDDRLAREGWAVLCRADDVGCVGEAERQLAGEPRGVRLTYEAAPSFLGTPAPPVRFVFVLVPPN